MPSHKQVLIQVRATVDEKIVDLVKVINLIPYAYTLSSCEGDASNNAFIMFSLHSLVKQDSLSLLENLTVLLSNCPGVDIQLKWKFGGPVFYLVLPHDKIVSVSRKIKDGLKKKNNSETSK